MVLHHSGGYDDIVRHQSPCGRPRSAETCRAARLIPARHQRSPRPVCRAPPRSGRVGALGHVHRVRYPAVSIVRPADDTTVVGYVSWLSGVSSCRSCTLPTPDVGPAAGAVAGRPTDDPQTPSSAQERPEGGLRLPVAAVRQAPSPADGAPPQGERQHDRGDDPDRGGPEEGRGHHHGRRGDGDGGVEGVAPNTAGTRRRSRSRIAPPPTAVIVPMMIAAGQPRPASNVRCTPTTDQIPMTAASRMVNRRSQVTSENDTKKATSAPAIATGTYSGSTSATGGPFCSRVSRRMPRRAGDEADDEEPEQGRSPSSGRSNRQECGREHAGEVEHVRDRCQALGGQQVHENHQTPPRGSGEPRLS